MSEERTRAEVHSEAVKAAEVLLRAVQTLDAPLFVRAMAHLSRAWSQLAYLPRIPIP